MYELGQSTTPGETGNPLGILGESGISSRDADGRGLGTRAEEG